MDIQGLKFHKSKLDGYGKSTFIMWKKGSSPSFIASPSPPRKTKVKKTVGWKLNSWRDLEKEFGRFGPLEKCKVVLDGKSGQVNPLRTFLNRFKLLFSREALPFWPLKESMMLRRQGIPWLIQVGIVRFPDPLQKRVAEPDEHAICTFAFLEV